MLMNNMLLVTPEGVLMMKVLYLAQDVIPLFTGSEMTLAHSVVGHNFKVCPVRECKTLKFCLNLLVKLFQNFKVFLFFCISHKEGCVLSISLDI